MLIGAGAAVLLLSNGKTAGVSGIVERALHGTLGKAWWRLSFLVGLVVPVLVFHTSVAVRTSGLTLAAAGLLIGFGTRVGGGCTSGHGVCGISSGSVRSVVATLIFVLSAMVAVFFVRHLSPK
jgi:uncharacterized membrane protein YedE/YeeE